MNGTMQVAPPPKANVSELISVLELVGDKDKTLKVLKELSEKIEEYEDLFQKTHSAQLALSNERAKIEVLTSELENKTRVSLEKSEELSAKIESLSAANRSNIEGAQALERDRNIFEKTVSEKQAEFRSSEESISLKMADALELKASAISMKSEYEQKLANLKAITG